MYKIYSLPINITYPQVLRDSPRSDSDILMERYLNDMYTIYMNKLSAFILHRNDDPNGVYQLRAMLEEIIKVRNLLNTNVDVQNLSQG